MEFETSPSLSPSAPRANPAPPALLHEFFERAARRWPDRIAIDTPPAPTRPQRRTITYAQLDGRASLLAGVLRSHVKGECVVAILLPRDSEHLYLAQLAVLKSGAAHACLDPAFPDNQIGDVLTDAQAVAVLTDAAGAARIRQVKPDPPAVLDVIEWREATRGAAGTPPPPAG